MMNNTLAELYERDIHKLIDEVNLFRNEEDLWKVRGLVKNSCGNLVLHMIGSMNYHIGTNIAKTGYVRNRDLEFTNKGIPKQKLIDDLEKLAPLISTTINSLTKEQMKADYAILFDNVKSPVSYILVQLLLHLNYHLGQINYLRRIIE